MRAREYVNGISNMRCTFRISASHRLGRAAITQSPPSASAMARYYSHCTTSLPDPRVRRQRRPATGHPVPPITGERVGAEQPTEGRARSRAQRPGRTQTRRR